MHNGAVERLIDPKKIWAIVLKNWMVLKGDKVRLIPLLLFPVIMIAIFGYATGSSPKHLEAAVVDYDHTPCSQGVQDQLASLDVFTVKYVVGTQDEGRALLDRGAIKVLFILPKGMGEKAAAGDQVEMDVMVDEADSSVAQIAKSSAQTFAQQLSVKLTQQRLAALSAQAQSARQDLAQAGAITKASQNPLAASASQDSVAAYWVNANYVFARSNAGIGATVLGLQNSLGYLVDQNEIVSSYSPASVSTATLTLLATGDQQQSVLQSIGSYQGIQAAQAMIMRDAAGIYSNYMKMGALAAGQEKAAVVSAKFIGSADAKLSSISAGAADATAPVSVQVLEPYGYGRRAVDFLIPSILALIIFQGATMGLGRAIAGEKKDGSLTRVFLTPTSNTTIILGTQFFYLLLEMVRSSFIIIVAMILFSFSISGSILDIAIIITIFAMGCTGIGMVLSVLTHSQEQYMALGMLISLPVMFLSGVFFPVQTMPSVLQAVSKFIPLTYAADALRGVMVKGFTLGQVFPDIVILTAFAALMLTLSLILFKRELV
ncbi:ABC-2 family transporter protein [uncultured archaeon]|nr:ABC-2 family transporter protein [uncultured archaeon]